MFEGGVIFKIALKSGLFWQKSGVLFKVALESRVAFYLRGYGNKSFKDISANFFPYLMIFQSSMPQILNTVHSTLKNQEISKIFLGKYHLCFLLKSRKWTKIGSTIEL